MLEAFIYLPPTPAQKAAEVIVARSEPAYRVPTGPKHSPKTLHRRHEPLNTNHNTLRKKELARTAQYIQEKYGIRIERNDMKAQLDALGIEPAKIEFDNFSGEAIRIKIRDEDGEFVDGTTLIRLTDQTIRQLELYEQDEKTIPAELKAGNSIRKYLVEGDLRGKLYHAQGSELEAIRESNKAIFITEGAMKAIKLNEIYGDTAHIIGLNGIDAYKQRGKLISEFAKMNLVGRPIYLVPDGDFQTNNEVRQSTFKLAIELKAKGADLRVVELPAEIPMQDQNGIDDFLNHHGAQARVEFEKLINDPNRTKVMDHNCLLTEGLISENKHSPLTTEIIKAKIKQEINSRKGIERINTLIIVISFLRDASPNDEIARLQTDLETINNKNHKSQRVQAINEFLTKDNDANLNKIAELIRTDGNKTLDSLPRDKRFGVLREGLKFFGYNLWDLESPVIKHALRDLNINSLAPQDYNSKIEEIDRALKLFPYRDYAIELVEFKQQILYRKLLDECLSLPAEKKNIEHNIVEFIEYYDQKHQEATGEKLDINHKQQIFKAIINLENIDNPDTANFTGEMHLVLGKYRYSQLPEEAKLQIKTRLETQLNRKITELELQAYLGKVKYRLDLARVTKSIMNIVGTEGLLKRVIEAGAIVSTIYGNPGQEGAFAEIIAASNYKDSGHKIEVMGTTKPIKLKDKTIDAEIDVIHKGTLRIENVDIRTRFFSEVKSSFNAFVQDYRASSTDQLEIPEFDQLDRVILAAKNENAQPVININTKGALTVDSTGKAIALKTSETGVNTIRNISDSYKLIKHYENKYRTKLIVVNEKGIDIRPLMKVIAGSKA